MTGGAASPWVSVRLLGADGRLRFGYTDVMTSEETIARLRALEPELRDRGVCALFLFGSHVRGDAGPNSDVDLFFDDDPADPLSYFSVIGVERYIEQRLKSEVDLIPRDSLHRLAREEIVASAQQVY